VNEDIKKLTTNKKGDFSMEELFSVLTNALARAGYEVLDGDEYRFVIRNKAEDEDYEISICQIVG
jgi:hypothetical protein